MIFGPVKFDVEARRIYGIRSVKLVVKDGAFTQWDGNKPVASAELSPGSTDTCRSPTS